MGQTAGSNVALPPPALPATSDRSRKRRQNGPGGPGSVVAETSGGLVVNLLFDAAAMAAPQSFRQGIEQAAAILSGAISDKITVNLNIDYSGTGGGAAAGPDSGQFVSYTTIRADLINDATPGDTTFNALPSGSTIQGQSSVAVWNAQLKLLGLARRERHHHGRRQCNLCHRHQSELAGRRCAARTDPRDGPRPVWTAAGYFRSLSLHQPGHTAAC